MNNEEEKYYQNKKQEYLDAEAKFSKEQITEMREHAFTLISESIQENCKKYPIIPKDVVEKWTVTHRMWSAMYLKNISETIQSLECVIDALKNLSPTGTSAWGRESVITFLWNDLDNGKAHLKTALNYVKLSSQKKEFDV